MRLSRPLVVGKAEEYAEEEPLYPVEEEAIETYPAAFGEGEFGWRDAEWVVQWHYRRFLGAYPEDRRREGEERFGENERGAVHEAVLDAANADGLEGRVDRLRELEGVDLSVASAFLQFIDPERYMAVDERTWGALYGVGELEDPYSDPVSVEEYREFIATCRRVAGELDVDLWTLYRALWRIGRDERETDDG